MLQRYYSYLFFRAKCIYSVVSLNASRTSYFLNSSYFSIQCASFKISTTQFRDMKHAYQFSNNVTNAVDGILGGDTSLKSTDAARIELSKIVELLVLHGLDSKSLGKHSDLLQQHPSYVKANLLTKFPRFWSDFLVLISLPLSILRLAVKRARDDCKVISDFPDRISYLCHHLDLETVDLMNLLTKHTPLLTMSFAKLDSKMKILKNAQIDAEDIVRDPWIFNYNECLLNKRICAAEKAGFSLKPWLLRCTEEHFNILLENWKATQVILSGKDDQVSYLARKLHCSKDYIVHCIMKKNSLLHTINILKLEKVIEYLYSNGYTAEELRLFPKVFCSNIETLRHHFEKFQQVRGGLPTIPQLCNSKLFNDAMKNVVKDS